MSDILSLSTDKSGSEVSDLEVVYKLCCPTKPPNRNTCLPCMLINIQLNSSDDEESGYEDNFGVRDDNEDDDGNDSKIRVSTRITENVHRTRAVMKTLCSSLHVCVFCSERGGVL